MSVWTAEASRVDRFYSCRSASADLSPSAHTKARYGSHKNLCSNIELELELAAYLQSMAGVSAGMLSMADVRSVSDAEALLAQLDREEVSL